MANSTCAEIQHAKQEKRVENSTFAKKNTNFFKGIVNKYTLLTLQAHSGHEPALAVDLADSERLARLQIGET